MATLTMPSILPSEADFGLISNTQEFTSPLAGTTQTVEMPGTRWVARLVYTHLNDGDRRALAAFLAELNGMAGRFFVTDPSYDAVGPLGAASGTPIVDSSGQTGTLLTTTGWTASLANILKVGDYLQFTNSASGIELHMVTSNTNTLSGGTATVPIAPPIRNSPGSGATITVSGAACVMRLVDDSQFRSAIKAPNFATIDIQAIEVFTDA